MKNTKGYKMCRTCKKRIWDDALQAHDICICIPCAELISNLLERYKNNLSDSSELFLGSEGHR